MRQINLVGANLIEKDGKFLLIQEGKQVVGVTGKWNLPAGKMDFDEKIIDCAKREAEEETGYKVDLDYLIGVWQYSDKRDENDVDIMIFVFKSNIVAGKLMTPNEEIMSLQWFTKDEIIEMYKKGKMRHKFPFIVEVIEDFESGNKIDLTYLKWRKDDSQ